jgi:hypothetical protein
MSPARAAATTTAVIIGIISLFIVSSNGGPLLEWLLAIAWLGAPLATAGGIIAYRLAARVDGVDLADRLLSLVTADREEWDRAMRAELASIEGSRERRRFAFGCLITTLRVGTGRVQWIVALSTGIVLALATLVTSRVQLGGGRTGILVATLYGPAVVIFVVSLINARAERSFRAGLVTGILALLSAMLLVFAVAVVEASRWWEVAGVYVMDGDSPRLPIDRAGAMLDAVSPTFVLFHLVIWISWPVLGAALGAGLSRPVEEARPAATDQDHPFAARIRPSDGSS